ncbi:MAG TPA: hypothetical protein VHV10_02310 [Ktedonobacteraceae bacterium]|jgi:hypothetical protein|nr:hypothetical protein [Ktedonobacteraceae bacterium]
MWRVYGCKSDYLKAPRLEAQKQWIRSQAEVQVDKEKEETQRKEIERG